MNIYARYFDQEVLVHELSELIDFLVSLEEINVTDELVEDIRNYLESDIPYPKRYKIRQRVYFILIKTTADTLEEFRENKKSGDAETSLDSELINKKELRASLLAEENVGWYRGEIVFKRVIQIPGTGKFQYQDTPFSAFVKARSGMDCYNRIIDHLKGRSDLDLRSQFPSPKGTNFDFEYLGAELSGENKVVAG